MWTPGKRDAALAAVAAVAFAGLGLLVHATPVADADAHAVANVHAWVLDHRGSIRPWRLISDWLSPDVLRIAALPLAAALWVRRRHSDAATVVLAALGTLLLSTATKALFDRDRPRLVEPIARAGGQSYPSGHALTSFVAGALVLVLVSPGARRWAYGPTVVLVALVGVSRIVLGVHFPTDVLGGWLLGLAFTAAVLLAVRDVAARSARSRLTP